MADQGDIITILSWNINSVVKHTGLMLSKI